MIRRQRKRKSLIGLLVLFILTTSYYDAFSAYKDSVEFHLTIPKAEILTWHDLTINLTITSKQRAPLVLPKDGVIGYVHGEGFFLIEAQKKINGKYVTIQGDARIDNPPSYLDTLHMNDTRKFKFSLALFYQYTKGDYRIRVLTILSQLNPTKDIYSNWVYFSCKKEIYP